MEAFLIYITALCLFHSSDAYFTVTQKGLPYTDVASGISRDHNGTLYISGYTDASAYNTTAGSLDIYITKYFDNGTLILGAQHGGAGVDASIAQTLSHDESTLYITGWTTSSWFATFTGSECGFIISIETTNLTLKWGGQLCGNYGNTQFFHSAVSPTDPSQIYVSGFSQGNFTAYGLTNSGGYDALLLRYNSTGNLIWVRLLGSAYKGDDVIYDVIVDDQGIIWGGGYTVAPTVDCFVSQWNSSGSLLTQQIFTSPYADLCWGIALDGNGGAYLSGASTGVFNSAGVATGYTSYYQPTLMRMNSSLSIVWMSQQSTFQGSVFYITLKKGPDNMLYTTGWGDAVTFNGAAKLGQYDVPLAVFDPNGQLKTSLYLGTSQSDLGLSMTIDKDLNIFISGYTNGSWASPLQGAIDMFWVEGTSVIPASPSPSPSPSASPSSVPSSQPEKSSSGSGHNMIIIIAASAGGGVLLLASAAIITFFILKRRGRNNRGPELPQKEPYTYAESQSSMPMSPARSVRDASWEIDYNKLQRGKELGRGAFGVVYLATWRNSAVAVKQLDTDNTNAHSAAVFLKEAQNVRNLRPHPNICTILGVCTDPKYPICIVMEYIPFGSLNDMLIEKKIVLTPWTVIQFAKDIASGMGHLHAESILHCDLACRNLLVAARGNEYQIKISDFGLSRMVEAQEYVSSSNKGVPVRWCAPETLKMGKLSRASDVWSFGITMWEMIEETKPYPNLSNNEVVAALDKGFRLPEPTKQDLPYSFYKLMLLCWAEKPSERPSFDDISQELAKIENEIPKRQSIEPPVVPPKKKGHGTHDEYNTFSTFQQETYNNIALKNTNNNQNK